MKNYSPYFSTNELKGKVRRLEKRMKLFSYAFILAAGVTLASMGCCFYSMGKNDSYHPSKEALTTAAVSFGATSCFSGVYTRMRKRKENYEKMLEDKLKN